MADLLPGFNAASTFVSEGASNIAATGSKTGVYTGNVANYAYIRIKKHASQSGGTTPVAYISYDSSQTAPGAANSIPLYDGDGVEIGPADIKSVSLASADSNQPTVHYVLRTIGV